MPFNGEFGQLSYTSLQLYLNHFVCLNERNYLDKIAVEMFINYFDLALCRPLLLTVFIGDILQAMGDQAKVVPGQNCKMSPLKYRGYWTIRHSTDLAVPGIIPKG